MDKKTILCLYRFDSKTNLSFFRQSCNSIWNLYLENLDFDFNSWNPWLSYIEYRKKRKRNPYFSEQSITLKLSYEVSNTTEHCSSRENIWLKYNFVILSYWVDHFKQNNRLRLCFSTKTIELRWLGCLKCFSNGKVWNFSSISHKVNYPICYQLQNVCFLRQSHYKTPIESEFL